MRDQDPLRLHRPDAGCWTRRTLLSAGAAAVAAPAFAQSLVPAAVQRRSRLILLGTKGGPTPSRFRAPASNLLLVDSKPFVIDCPDGTARQLVLAGVDLPRVEHLFVTHHHSDHTAGLAGLLLLAWGSGLKTPLTVYGPPPLDKLVRASLQAATPDIETRVQEEGRPPLPSLIRTRELAGQTPVAQFPLVKVTCAAVDHFTMPALAYRFDTPDRSFVFSGDTAPSDALVALAKGADVLVHEAMLPEALGRITDGNAPALMDHLLKSHTTTEQLGRVAAAAGVQTLVLSHLVPAFHDISDEAWSAGVRKNFKGQVIVGRDMMEI